MNPILHHLKFEAKTEQIGKLTKVFRDVYGYMVETAALPTPNAEDDVYSPDSLLYNEALLDKIFKPGLTAISDTAPEDVLQITCYLGAAVCQAGDKSQLSCLSAVPCSRFELRDKYEASGGGNWLGKMTGLPELYTDTLLILDCNLDSGLEPVTAMRSEHGQSFQAIAAKYSNPDIRPGELLGNLASVLESTASSSLQRRDPFTAFTLSQVLHKAMAPSNSQGVLFWTNGMANDRENMVVVERSLSPLFEIGEYQELGSCHSMQLYEDAELLYENGITKVSKVSMLPGTHRFSKGDATLTCAIKQLRPRYQSQASTVGRLFLEELQVLRYISSWKHEHIFDFLAAFKAPSDGRFGSFTLILPYADGGSLHEFLRLSEAPNWLREATSSESICDVIYSQILGLLDGLAVVHSKVKSSEFIIHRDIKSSNILIQHGTFKLADFGLARIKAVDETSKTDWYAGTPMYAPPERTVEGRAGFGRTRDAWAMGCVFLEILILLCYGFSKTPEVEVFEQDRLKSSGEHEVRAFSLTMDCVSDRLDHLGKMLENIKHSGDRRKLEAMLSVARGMLHLDPAERMTSLLARDKMREQLSGHQLHQPPHDGKFARIHGLSPTEGLTDGPSMTYFKPDGSAVVDVMFVKPGFPIETVQYRMVLDTGAKFNGMSQDVQRGLGLPLETSKRLAIRGFLSRGNPLGKVTVEWHFAGTAGRKMYRDTFYVFKTDQYETLLADECVWENGYFRRKVRRK